MSDSHLKPSTSSYELTSIHDAETESAEPIFAQETPKDSNHSHPRTFSEDAWGLEILSVSTSLILFIGMGVIFFTMQDKPVSRWPFGISINAAIAILSTACTAATMYNVSAFIGQLKWLYLKARPRQLDSVQVFDGASRGPYGSIIFLFKISWNMATLGAVITILRLGFSPMVQQVISLEPRQIPIPDKNVTFGFAHSYNRSRYPGHNSEVYPDPQMQSAIIKGLYDIHAAPMFSCGGTCSWKGSYVSLGFKSVCKDVTVSTLKTISCTNETGGSGAMAGSIRFLFGNPQHWSS